MIILLIIFPKKMILFAKIMNMYAIFTIDKIIEGVGIQKAQTAVCATKANFPSY